MISYNFGKMYHNHIEETCCKNDGKAFYQILTGIHFRKTVMINIEVIHSHKYCNMIYYRLNDLFTGQLFEAFCV